MTVDMERLLRLAADFHQFQEEAREAEELHEEELDFIAAAGMPRQPREESKPGKKP